MVFGMSWVATGPWIAPPMSFWSPVLSTTQLTALRTWMSSNGAMARFMLMYHVPNVGSEWMCDLRVGEVTNERIPSGFGRASIVSSSPAAILFWRSATVPPTETSNSSTYALRMGSVAASHDGLRTRTYDFP